MTNQLIIVIITFDAITDALTFEALAATKGLRGRLAPIPHNLSAGCGIAWLTDTKDYENAAQLLKKQPEIDGTILLYDSLAKKIHSSTDYSYK